jgi:hypothetical protein
VLEQKPPQLPSIGEIHLMARERLANRHAHLLEKIQRENSHKDKYWILGMAMCKRKHGKTTIRPFLKAYDKQPEIQKESYLYEVDNIAGTKTLLWVMHPNNKLSLPSINKSIRVAGESGVSDLAAEVTGEYGSLND